MTIIIGPVTWLGIVAFVISLLVMALLAWALLDITVEVLHEDEESSEQRT